MTVRARMKCTEITLYEGQASVKLQAFYSSDKTDPNYSYSAATPAANVHMTITNRAAIDAFQVGKFYLIDFIEEKAPA